jgi:hypothetical protein
LRSKKTRIAIDRETASCLIEPIPGRCAGGSFECIYFGNGVREIARMQIDLGAGDARFHVVTLDFSHAANGHEIRNIGP